MNTATPSPIVGLLPLILIGIFWAIVMTPITKRKGKEVWLNWVMCFIPIVNILWIIHILSLTDEKINRELTELRQIIERKQ